MTSHSSTVGTLKSRLQKSRPMGHSQSADSLATWTSTAPTKIKVSSPWHVNYIFKEEDISFPKKLLFHDYLCTKPLDTIDLKGWIVCPEIFEIIKNECPNIRILILDDVIGLNLECFQYIRGLKHLRILSLQRIVNCTITNEIAHIIASYKLLHTLKLTNCHILSDQIFITLSQSCKYMKILLLSACKGLNNPCLHAIAQWIGKYRKLNTIDFSYCNDIHDDGVLEIFVLGYNIIKDINLSYCKQLTTTALTGVRTKMMAFQYFNISHMNIGNTIYEWLAEGGGRNLIQLNISNNSELDDAGLIHIGRKCSLLKILNISNCLNITDYGINHFSKYFQGDLKDIDLSYCIQLTSSIIKPLIRIIHTIKHIKFNCLSQLDANSIKLLWNHVNQLETFEMCSNNSKTIIMHRQSTMPHLSDSVFMHTTMPYLTLRSVKLSGCFQLTNIGLCSLVRACLLLEYIDISYCNSIGDIVLYDIAEYLSELEVLIVTGCVQVTSEGVRALSTGKCQYKLKQLELNGCHKVHDAGVMSIGNMQNLEILKINSCEYVTDVAIITVAKQCKHLHSIHLNSLDYININVIQQLTEHCPYLTILNAENCNFTAIEYKHIVYKNLPFATPIPNKCRLMAHTTSIINYNKYVIKIHKHIKYIKILQKFGKYIIGTYLLRLAKKLKKKELLFLKKIFSLFSINIQKSKKQNMKIKKNSNALILQEKMKSLYVIYIYRRQARILRKQRDARVLIQRCYRGYYIRKRINKKFARLFYYYHKIGYLVYKYMLITAARRNHRRIVCVQAFGRMIPIYINYKLLLYAITSIQLKYKYYYKKKKEIIHQKHLELLQEKERMIRCNHAASIIQKNWKASYYNKLMSKYILMCCVYYRIQYDEQLWYSIIIQKYMRRFIIQCRIYNQKRKNDQYIYSTIKIQSIIRKYIIYNKKYKKLKKKLKKLNKKYRFFFIYSLPKLRIGKIIRIIQKFTRYCLFKLRRYYSSVRIQCNYRGYMTRKKVKILIYMMHTDKVNAIKRVFYLYKLRYEYKILILVY